MKTLPTLLFLLCSFSAFSQQHKDELTKNISFEKQSAENLLYVTNINGGIEINGYDGDEIQIKVARTLNAKTGERLKKGIEEVGIGVLDRYDTLIVYMKNGCDNFRWDVDKRGYNWDYNDCDVPYDFRFDITVLVPRNLNIYASTVNRGDVNVAGVAGTLELRNINGDISASGIQRTTVVNTINGDVSLEYTRIPESGKFYSLNGDIVANYPPGFKASVTFKSFNGDFYTNVDDIAQEPVMIKTNSNKKGISFKAETKSAITFRGGGAPLDFETFNGDVFIKEN